MPRRTFLEQIDQKDEVAEAPGPTMTLEEVRAEIARLDTEEREEAEAPARRAEELARRREEEQQRIAEARKRVAQRYAGFGKKTVENELRKFDKRMRKKGYR